MINDVLISEIRKILNYYTVRNKLGAVAGFNLESASLAILRLINNPPEAPKEEEEENE